MIELAFERGKQSQTLTIGEDDYNIDIVARKAMRIR